MHFYHCFGAKLFKMALRSDMGLYFLLHIYDGFGRRASQHRVFYDGLGSNSIYYRVKYEEKFASISRSFHFACVLPLFSWQGVFYCIFTMIFVDERLNTVYFTRFLKPVLFITG